MEGKSILEDVIKPIENDPNYDEFMKQFRLKCPCKKINLSVSDPNTVVGMWLIADDNSIEVLKEKADMADVVDTTILGFTHQHIIELTNIIYGIAILFAENKVMPKEDIFKLVCGYSDIFNKIQTYGMYKDNIILSDYTDRNKNIFFMYSGVKKLPINKFIEIMKYIIFVPYNELDNIAKSAIEEFKKQEGTKDEQ